MPSKIRIGEKYGRLTVCEPTDVKDRKGQVLWKFACECGNSVLQLPYAVMSGNTHSCGCLRRDTTRASRITHGMSNTTEHRIWRSMLSRCYNSNRWDYKYYGGRGVGVYPSWHEFANFYRDVGPRPSLSVTLDRYPNKFGNYEPGNVRWATNIEQQRNTTRNRFLTLNGRTQTLTEWGRELGIEPAVLRNRIDRRKWSVERALSTPLLNRG